LYWYVQYREFCVDEEPWPLKGIMSMWYDENVLPRMEEGDVIPDYCTLYATKFDTWKFHSFIEHHKDFTAACFMDDADPVTVIAQVVAAGVMSLPVSQLYMVEFITAKTAFDFPVGATIPSPEVILKTHALSVKEINFFFKQQSDIFIIDFELAGYNGFLYFEPLNSYYPKKAVGLPTEMYFLEIDSRTPESVRKWATYHIGENHGNIDAVYKYLYKYWRKDEGLNIIRLYGKKGTSKWWFSQHDLIIGKPKILP